MAKKILWVMGVALICLVGYLVAIKIRSLDYADSGPGLAVRWEGFYHDYNYRDVGQSLNKCLGKQVFETGLLLRSAGWFSGWSCDGVGNPDTIFSLNFAPKKGKRYFCQGDQGKTIGRYTNPDIKLNDLEFLTSWDNERMRQPVCRFLEEIFEEMRLRRKSLIHCDAGRDRTGAVTALIVGLSAEANQMLTPRMLDAIECDYRKTRSLDEHKYDRMKHFIEELQARGGVRAFLTTQCQLDTDLMMQVATGFIRSDYRYHPQSSSLSADKTR